MEICDIINETEEGWGRAGGRGRQAGQPLQLVLNISEP